MEEIIRTARGDFPALVEGPADGQLVLLLHGFPDIPHTFVTTQKLLAAAGLRAVAPWLRGYAPAPLAGPFDVDTIAADLDAMAHALDPARPAALVGHDWGAACAYAAAARYPETFRCAVTAAVPHPLAFLRSLGRDPSQLRRSWYMLLFQAPQVAERALARDDHALVDRLWAAWSPGLRPPVEHLARVKRCLAASGSAPLGHYRAMLRPPREALARLSDPAMRRIRVPTVHLQGADDGCIGPDSRRGQERYFTGFFRSEIIADAGHFLPLERPALLAERTLELLARPPGRGTA